jgi:hypothetical protein
LPMPKLENQETVDQLFDRCCHGRRPLPMPKLENQETAPKIPE